MSTQENVSSLIDKQFLEDALKNYMKDSNLQVINFSLSNATDKGDNYTSDMFRVKVTYSMSGGSNVEKSIIAKFAPIESGDRKDLVEKISMFPREIKVMSDILVEMNKILKSLNEDKLSADIIFARLEPPTVLVMEDLKSAGFKMIDRQAGTDLQHSVLIIKNLAKFHASSLLYLESQKYDEELFKNRAYSTYSENHVKQMVIDGYKTLGEEMRNWQEVDSSYPEKLIQLADTAFDKCKTVVVRDDREFNVLNHGDLWTNNIMFRYDEHGKPDQLAFVDFQMCCHTSPAVDIGDLFCNNLNEDVYWNYRDYLLDVYLDALTPIMKRIGCKVKPPSIQELKASLDKYAYFELTQTVLYKPIAVADKADAAEMFELTDITNVKCLRNPKFRKAFVKRLPSILKRTESLG